MSATDESAAPATACHSRTLANAAMTRAVRRAVTDCLCLLEAMGRSFARDSRWSMEADRDTDGVCTEDTGSGNASNCSNTAASEGGAVPWDGCCR